MTNFFLSRKFHCCQHCLYCRHRSHLMTILTGASAGPFSVTAVASSAPDSSSQSVSTPSVVQRNSWCHVLSLFSLPEAFLTFSTDHTERTPVAKRKMHQSVPRGSRTSLAPRCGCALSTAFGVAPSKKANVNGLMDSMQVVH